MKTPIKTILTLAAACATGLALLPAACGKLDGVLPPLFPEQGPHAPHPPPPAAERSACGVDNPLTDLAWLAERVAHFEAHPEQRSFVFACRYQGGHEGFMIEECNGCPDIGRSIFDCQGHHLGVLFGLTGRGYADFGIDESSIVCIYQNQ